ncbi:phage tail sheath family protein [Actinoplanes octamycinicus]
MHREDRTVAAVAGPVTGVPVFLGYAVQGPIGTPQPVDLWDQFVSVYGAGRPGFLGAAVRGFFGAGGTRCHVLALAPDRAPEDALSDGLAVLTAYENADLICVPDVVRDREGGLPPAPEQVRTMQRAVLDHCVQTGDRFAILDPLPGVGRDALLAQAAGLSGRAEAGGALYHPWVRVAGGALVPPCGHLAGVYAATDAQSGVHHAPANVVLAGVTDLAAQVTDAEQAVLNPAGVNCLRAFPGRGIRVWGARTLSTDPLWRYVSVRRLWLSVARRLDHTMRGLAFEPNAPPLWARIVRELTAVFHELFRQGALAGRTAEQGFYVKCDAETNTFDVRARGMAVAEVGFAPCGLHEFVVVRIVSDGATIAFTASAGDG